MKITFLQDLDPLVFGGGAQATDRMIILEAFRRGHEVEIVTPETFRTNVYDSDLVFVSNTVRFPQGFVRYKNGPPYVVFHHDYYWCRFRLYFSLEEKCKTCLYLPPWRQIYEGARLNIFMSPLHRDACLSVLPGLSASHIFLCPSLLDPARWTDPSLPRTADSVLGVNSMLPYKGRANVLQYAQNHPELQFTFAGYAEGEGELPPNAKWIGPADDNSLRQMYGSHERFIHLPATPQPCERTVIEARLSGCRLILNRLVGASSYPEWNMQDDEFRKWLAGRPRALWEEIENA